MGKHGPCYHCGVTSTPLWRNGPPDKPVLCNACGSRWRTKGSLTNYTPLHARGPLEQLDDFKVSKEKSTPLKPRDQKLPKSKKINGDMNSEFEMVHCDQNFHRVLDEDFSNRSSSGSAVSYSESCAHFGGSDVTDVTGTLQPNVWDSLVPSKKRTGVTRPKSSSVEKLTKDLHSIMYQQSSYLSELSEDDLLYENCTSNGSVEIGNGSILIRNSNLATLDEESEASSLPIENKFTYSGLSIPVHIQGSEPRFPDISNEKAKRPHAAHDNGRRDKLSQDIFQILLDRDSQMGSKDLADIVSFEGFMQHLTYEEQQCLLQYLPSVDTAKSPGSLKNMFTSPQFQDALHCFQMLLHEGVFDLSFSGATEEKCRNLKRLVLLDMKKSTWVEYHKILKDTINKQNSCNKRDVRGSNEVSTSISATHKRPHESQNQNFQEMKVVIKNPKKVCRIGAVNLSMRSPSPYPGDVGTKSVLVTNDHLDNEGSSFSPRSLFAYPSDRSSMMDSFQLADDRPGQDLLLDMRSTNSFPEAELLPSVWKSSVTPNNFAESGTSEKEDGISRHPA